MPTKRKPKLGWKDHGFSQSARKYFSDQAFQKIETALKVPMLNDDIRAEIIKAAQNYFDVKASLVGMPRTADVKAALEECQDKTKVLIDLLENLDSISKDVLTSTNIELFTLFDGQSDIYKLHSAASEALKSLKRDRGGQSISRRDLKFFIIDLHDLYFQITGKKAPLPTKNPNTGKYGGKFFDFVDACLKIIGEKIQNTTLDSQIRAAFKIPFLR